MKPFTDLATWLLEKDIRTKNALSFLLSLLAVVCFYLGLRDTELIKELDRRGPLAVPAALTIIFLIAFLLVWLIGTAFSRHHGRTRKKRQRLTVADQRQTHIRKTLGQLTEWQVGFVRRYIVEQTTQIPEFEVGQYRAAWDYEMEMLIQKGVVRHHRKAGVYEIEPVYRDYLLEHWDQQTGTLG